MSSLPLFRKPDAPRPGAGMMEGANRTGFLFASDKKDPMSRSISDTLDDFYRLQTDEAKAGFANQWVGVLNPFLTETWRVVYELGSIVRKKELFKHAKFMHGEVFPTFEAWWEQRTGKAIREFAELEKTHRFAESAGLLRLSYEDATAARQAVVDNTPVVAEHGGNADTRPRDENGAFLAESSRAADGRSGVYGTNRVPYLLGRIKREAQAGSQVAVTALQRYVAGEISANKAAVEAGVKKPTLPIDTVLRALPKLSDDELRAVVAKLNELQERKSR